MSGFLAHVEQVETAVSSASAAARSRVAASWRRSRVLHGLDPAERRSIAQLEEAAFAARMEQFAVLQQHAAIEMDRLFKLVGQSGSGLFLADREGIVIDRRCHGGDEDAFDTIGLRPGAICAETHEGTNGLGTTLAEERPIIIHRGDHFYAKNLEFTCIGAPLFGSWGELVGVLDLSTARRDHHSSSNLLLASAVVQSSKRIEAALFRDCFHSQRIVVIDLADQDDLALLAIDKDDFVVGATRAARLSLGWGLGRPVVARPAADILGQPEGGRDFSEVRRAAILRALNRASGNVSQAARQLGMGRATLYTHMKTLGIRK
ncbi:helix-turn-helix domain-containing protein [Marinovum sp.]|uniref:helix-turn-helix domain-containing protein n=1 Tax=Marinovum sp. TaxID=2024839 RepID=UPI002B268D79|nr:helix-turn-helix domain-containing protein [Marinovum sp.]